MKAVVLNGPNDFTAVEDYPKPQIGPRDMLLEMKRTAIWKTLLKIHRNRLRRRLLRHWYRKKKCRRCFPR